MSIITLDFETPYRSKKNHGTEGPNWSLKSLTYEEYLRGYRYLASGKISQQFIPHGVGVKIDRGEEEWIPRNQVQEALNDLYPENNDHRTICHNAYFDAAIMEWYYGVQSRLYWDTQSMSKAIWPTMSSSLYYLSKRCFPDNPEMWKQKEELEYSDGYWELNEHQDFIIGEYCKQDLRCTFNCFGHMWQMGFPAQELEIMDITVKMFLRRPFKLNRGRLEKHLAIITEKRDKALAGAGIPEKILSSNPQFANYLKNKHGIAVPLIPSPTKKNPDNQKLPLAKDDMWFIETQAAHPELEHLWKGRIASKSTLEITRCKRFLDHAEVCDINPEGHLASYLGYYNAHTGRWGGGNRTNHQNLGRQSELRPSLIAPEGQKVISRDLSNIEGRLSAWFCGQQDKLDFIKGGGDIYNRLGAVIYGKPIFRKQDEFKIEGHVSKTAELGLGYNMGAPKFQHTLATSYIPVLLPLDECKRIVNTWRSQNYAITAMWKKLMYVIKDMADPNMTPYGFGPNDCIRIEYCRIVFPNGLALNYPGLKPTADQDDIGGYSEFVYWDGEYWKKLYGGLLLENIIQGLARIIMADAMVRIQRNHFDLSLFFAIIGLTVHDELVTVADEEYAKEADKIMDDEMCINPSWADDDLFLQSSGIIADHYAKA